MAGTKQPIMLKLIVLGNAGVGKTSLLDRYVARRFSSQYKTTIGADLSTKDVQVGDDVVSLQIWDTAGQERFQSLGPAFYRGADACILVYDVGDQASFAKLDQWRDQFISSGDIHDRDFPFIVLGNKADISPSSYKVHPSAVEQWCRTKGSIPHFQVSAKTGQNVDEALFCLIKTAAAKAKEDDTVVPDTVKLDTKASKSEADGGCGC